MKSNLVLNIFVILLLNTIISSCIGAKKSVDEINPAPIAISMPCNPNLYKSDAMFFRSTGIASNQNKNTAYRMARLNAVASLSRNISITIQRITDIYIAENNIGLNETELSKFEDITNAVSENQISNVKIICEETEFKDGNYIVYLAVELPKESIFKDFEENFQNNNEIGKIYDKDLFNKVFIKETGNK